MKPGHRSSLMRTLCVVALLGLLAGCAENPSGARPPDWDAALELQAHSTGRSHSGAFDARVFPPDGTEPTEPAACTAFRAESSYRSDECAVIRADSEHWFPIGNPPWGLMATWQGRAGDTADNPDPDLPRTIVAYDARGVPVAFWAGANHPEASHATE